MGMGCAGLGRRCRRQIILTELDRCIHSLEIVALFIDVAPHFVVDWFTAADETEIFRLTDDRLEAEVSESGKTFVKVTAGSVYNVAFAFHAFDFPVFVEA